MRSKVTDPKAQAPSRLRTLVVDDEPLARDLLCRMVRKDPALQLVGSAGSGSEALAAIRQHMPHLLLLDIQMPSLDGISVAEQLASLDSAPYTIFVSAHDSYALQAYEVAVRDYLVKPVAKARFAAAISRAKREIGLVTDTSTEPVVVQNGQSLKAVMPDDLIWVGAANQYVRLHTVDGEAFMVSQSLRQFSRSLSETAFLRVHRSTLINKAHVNRVTKNQGNYFVVLSDQSEHAIARSRKSLVPELLALARRRSQ